MNWLWHGEWGDLTGPQVLYIYNASKIENIVLI